MVLSNEFEVLEIKKKSTAKLFKHIKVGDVIQVSICLNESGYIGATYAEILNKTRGESDRKPILETGKQMDMLEIRKI